MLRYLGLALLGDDGGLELGGSGLFGVGQRVGSQYGCGRNDGSRCRPNGLALQGWALSRSGRASGTLGHGVLDGPPSDGSVSPEDSIPPGPVAVRGPARLGPPPQEDPPIDLDALVQPHLGVIIAALVVIIVVLLLAVVTLARGTRRIDQRLLGLTRGVEGRSLEAVLDAHLDKVFAVASELDELAVRMAVLEGAQRRTFQRVGLIRYNPFDETGGNQSFALALLDAAGNGWVLSSLHARSGTRVYAKAIKSGLAEAGLSEEETAAIQRAMA